MNPEKCGLCGNITENDTEYIVPILTTLKDRPNVTAKLRLCPECERKIAKLTRILQR